MLKKTADLVEVATPYQTLVKTRKHRGAFLPDPWKDTDTQGEQFYRGASLSDPWKDTDTHGEQGEMVRRGQRVRGYVGVVQVLRSISSWQQSSQGATLPTIDLDIGDKQCARLNWTRGSSPLYRARAIWSKPYFLCGKPCFPK